MIYEIFEGNMERLESKLTSIYNKCRKYGCPFFYRQIGEIYKEVTDDSGHVHMARFLQVDVEGVAIVSGWEFAASVERTPDNKNIFHGRKDIEIPERYYDAEPICEHCWTKRNRSRMYIVHNKDTGEFAQVGSSCLKDFTHGMSAEVAAQYVSLFDTLIEGQAPMMGCRMEHYLDVEEFLQYAAETVHYFGYVKTDSEDDIPTAARALMYYEADRGEGMCQKDARQEMFDLGFNPDRQDVMDKVAAARRWITSQPEYSEYIHNLKTACSQEYASYKNAGILASLFPTYHKAIKRQQGDPFEKGRNSNHVGKVGERITICARYIKCMTVWPGEYGARRLYKIMDDDGDIYIWKTGKTLKEGDVQLRMVATVKGHDVFQDVKQTEVTRCAIR